jgi:hypothetical protein
MYIRSWTEYLARTNPSWRRSETAMLLNTCDFKKNSLNGLLIVMGLCRMVSNHNSHGTHKMDNNCKRVCVCKSSKLLAH